MNTINSFDRFSNEKIKAERNYKDTVFRMLLSDSKTQLQLYNALFNDNLDDTGLVEDCTLEDVLFRNRKNDVAFRVKNKRIIILLEHQSSINKNMPLRFLIYIGRTYEQLIDNDKIYREAPIDLDTPEFIVFYNGDDDDREYWELRLSDAFSDHKQPLALDLCVKVYNINVDKNRDLQDKVTHLAGYSYLIDRIKSHVNKLGTKHLSKAIELAIEDCIDGGILVNELKKIGSEVNNMLFGEWDQEMAIKIAKEEAEERGIEKGIEKGKAEGIEQGIEQGKLNERVNILGSSWVMVG